MGGGAQGHKESMIAETFNQVDGEPTASEAPRLWLYHVLTP
jgi:hypothetical protein